MLKALARKLAALAVLEPLLRRLVAADVKVPRDFRYTAEILLSVDVPIRGVPLATPNLKKTVPDTDSDTDSLVPYILSFTKFFTSRATENAFSKSAFENDFTIVCGPMC